VFWVISVYFNIRNTLPKFCPFLLGHPVFIITCYFVRLWETLGVICGDNIKIDLEERECDDVGMIHVHQDKVLWWGLASAIIKLPSNAVSS